MTSPHPHPTKAPKPARVLFVSLCRRQAEPGIVAVHMLPKNFDDRAAATGGLADALKRANEELLVESDGLQHELAKPKEKLRAPI